jgi:protein phosphatase
VLACEFLGGRIPNLFVVADGMGGHQAGDYASDYAINRMREIAETSETSDIVSFLNAAIALVNGELYQKSMKDEQYYGMGTTIVACSIHNEVLTVANVGDSRLYVCGRQIRQITKDHSLVEILMENGEIEKNSDTYNKKKNIITRAVGVDNFIKIDIFQIELFKGERILLCSDGLSNMLSDQQIEQIIHSGTEIEETAGRLIEVANENGGKDNIAVVLIDPELS